MSSVPKQEVLNLHLKTKHGFSPLLKTIVWKIPEEAISLAVVGTSLLKSVGCDSRRLLEATCGKILEG